METENLPIFYDDFVELWQEINGKPKSENWDEKYNLSSQLLNQTAIQNNQFVTIFDSSKQGIVFLSDNMREVLGENFCQEYYRNHPVLFWARNARLNQIWFLMKVSLFVRNKLQNILKENPKTSTVDWYFHNIQFNCNDKKIGIRGESLEITEKGGVRLQMSIMQDISGLIKDSDTWWAEIKVNEEIFFHFTPTSNKFTEGRLFTVRELEIIKLVSEGKETKEISDSLFLSHLTVDTHRKNILKKTGIKDFSSLIYILKLYNSI